jgi:uncharacterized membrane protein
VHWLGGFLGALFGALVGGGGSAFLGLVLGALVGWQSARIGELRRRLGTLEARIEGRIVVAAPPSPAPEVTVSAPEPTAAPPVPADGLQPEPLVTVPKAADEVRSPPAEASPAETPTGWGAPVAGAQTPTIFDHLGGLLRRWFIEGNVLVKLGALVLFVGVAAALKYASDQGLLRLPIELRLAAIALGAIALLVWGWRRRVAQPAFGLSLQGAALGILLLVVFAAFRLYGLLPSGAAFALVLLIVAGAAALALLQDAMALAVLGFVGGYLAPVLISTGTGNHVALFGYYAVMNAAVFAIAWVRPWRVLNLVGFAFSFAIMALWGWQMYRPEHYASIQPFLILFFLFYTLIPVLYALRQPPARRDLVDGTLIFGTPLIAFAMQSALLADQPLLLGFSALTVAALYFGLGWWLLRYRGVMLLGQAHAVLAVAFATLAVPLALSMRWTSAVWALEGVALVWLGLRQRRRLPQLAGWGLQGLAALAYLVSLFEGAWNLREGEWWLLNGHGMGLLMMAIAGFAIAWLYDRAPQRRRWLVWPPFLAGLFWWWLAGLREIDERLAEYVDLLLGHVGLLAVTVALAALARRALSWPRPGWVVPAAALLALPLALATAAPGASALGWPALAVWGALVAALLLALAGLREPRQRGLAVAHVGLLWVLALVIGIGLHHETRIAEPPLGNGWAILALGLPLGLLLAGTWWRPAWFAWPLAREFGEYRIVWAVSAPSVLGLLFLHGLMRDGSPAPLPFVPLLNPLELFQLVLLLASARLLLMATPGGDLQNLLRATWPLAAFLFITSASLRAVHHLAALPWSRALFDSALAQATLTVVWSVAGVGAWVLGSRLRRWPLWLAGPILMGLVLAKLILVDRRHVGDIAGIVSFMAVGALLVLVGRIAPTPPRKLEDKPCDRA